MKRYKNWERKGKKARWFQIIMYMTLSSSGFRKIEDQFIFQGAKCPRDSLLQNTIERRTPRIGPCHSLPPIFDSLFSKANT